MPIDHTGFLGRQFGNWVLDGVLKQSEFSTVYWARGAEAAVDELDAPSVWSRYVVKLAEASHHRPGACPLIEHEAQVLNAVRHPHVVSLLDAGRQGDAAYLVMPRLPGVLSGVFASGGTPPWQWGRLFWVARQVIAGLRGLHAAGWIHGDLKPSHLSIDSSLHVTLLDLGFARPCGEATAPSSKRVAPARSTEATGEPIVGTPDYLAPEVFLDGRGVGPAQDIYALGVMLYQWLTGKPPLQGHDLASWRQTHLVTRPQPLSKRVPDLASELAALIDRTLAKEPLRRPSLDELEAAFVRCEIETFADWQRPARRAA